MKIVYLYKNTYLFIYNKYIYETTASLQLYKHCYNHLYITLTIAIYNYLPSEFHCEKTNVQSKKKKI